MNNETEKCKCYHIEKARKYRYHQVSGHPIGYDVDVSVCWGTKNVEECSCGGDRSKCDFYPDVRAKARGVTMKINKRDQRVAADILMEFMFTNDMDDVIKVWNNVYEQYDLCSDPFTGVPCTPEEYCESRLEYDRQTMIERYGHCDGLE